MQSFDEETNASTGVVEVYKPPGRTRQQVAETSRPWDPVAAAKSTAILPNFGDPLDFLFGSTTNKQQNNDDDDDDAGANNTQTKEDLVMATRSVGSPEPESVAQNQSKSTKTRGTTSGPSDGRSVEDVMMATRSVTSPEERETLKSQSRMTSMEDEEDPSLPSALNKRPIVNPHAKTDSVMDSTIATEEKTKVLNTARDAQEEDDQVQTQAETEAREFADPTVDNDDVVTSKTGTVLEAAFVDPAYSWPPKDGEGRNAIELQASIQLLEDSYDADDISASTTPSMKKRMKLPKQPKPVKKKGPWWRCCQSTEAVDVEEMREYEERKMAAMDARDNYKQKKKDVIKRKEKEYRKKNKYSRVPEGVLIYRLDTTTHKIKLVSQPHPNTDLGTLIEEMYVVGASPSMDKSRRGIELVGKDGHVTTMIACEQRTATAWLEAMSLMFAKKERKSSFFGIEPAPASRWSREKLPDSELNNIEDQYLNLANYSHKLIRSGALPGGKKGSGGAGGIYYAIDKVRNDPFDESEEEALEAIAKRRAVIKDSWDFYRMICSLLRDRNKYEEVFRRMQQDPVYPYLNSMTGLNDPGDSGYENLDKPIAQKSNPEYQHMTKVQIATSLAKQAEAAMPSLVEICKALAGSLGMEEVGVGPLKEVDSALRKAEKKYNGDLLKVTDYCRALLVVKDFASLLALLELARDSFGPLIRRVKMSSLKNDHNAKPGGYRDCIINVELKEHICEIQVHIWPMWVICGVDGFRHYRHCVEYNTDSFEDAYDALDGLDRKTMAELIVMAEEAVAETPLDNLEWYHEKYILDYFAEAGLFLRHGLDVWAEITFRHLIRLRVESPDIGPEHHETIILYKYLAQALRVQGKYDAANQCVEKIKDAQDQKEKKKAEDQKTLWEAFSCAPQDAYDMLVDPTRKDREEEERLRKEVKASKRYWRKVRTERFPFLDADTSTRDADEKKVDDARVDSPTPQDQQQQSMVQQ